MVDEFFQRQAVEVTEEEMVPHDRRSGLQAQRGDVAAVELTAGDTAFDEVLQPGGCGIAGVFPDLP